jgi:thiamine biosynthesis protein ThiI
MKENPKRCVILHYSEIGLKGDNRKLFEDQLAKNIRSVLSDLFPARIKQAYGRFLLFLPEKVDWLIIRSRLNKVVGLANFALSDMVKQDVDQILRAACEQMRRLTFSTFGVTTRRIQKSFPMNSDALSAKVGAAIREQSKATVDLSNPEAVCYIEIFDSYAIVYSEKIPGIRGLPTGSSGKAVSLLSSGIDSPVASWKIISRGVKLTFVHFHSAPYTSHASMNNAKRLVKILTEYQLSVKLYCIPFLEIQQAIVMSTRADYRVVLYRRAMLRIAEKIARKERAHALVAGESIGQVASQTLANMRVISEVSRLPVLRPLAGDEKDKIVKLACQIGTFDISTEPYEDCCSLFVPKHPVTRAVPDIVYEAEEKLELKKLQIDAIRRAEINRFKFPV